MKEKLKKFFASKVGQKTSLTLVAIIITCILATSPLIALAILIAFLGGLWSDEVVVGITKLFKKEASIDEFRKANEEDKS